MAGVF
ncbi:hypothetical protein D021_0060A, partial [Vibrio parahaemolyticus 10296]